MPERRAHFWSRSIYGPVAAWLIAAQGLTGAVAVGLSAVLWETHSRELVSNSLALRLDAVAEEIEARAVFEPDATGLASQLVLSEQLRRDLDARFPDPVFVLLPDGAPAEPMPAPPPENVVDRLLEGRIAVELDDRAPWALVPLFDLDGIPAGGLLVRPLDASLDRERGATREATRRALGLVGLIALGSALLLGGLVTARLVGPLRRMTARVEAIGAGDYADRLPEAREDELGRLSAAINRMAAQVETSLASLRATDRLRRELVANIGHDLRTPLAALQGYAEEAERLLQAGRPAEAAEALAIARRQGRQVEALVRDLFELSVLDAAEERPPLHLEPVPVAELLTQAAAAHRPAIEAAGVTLTLAIPPGLPTLLADGVRLLRLLDNLLDNARRHTPAGGRIALEAEAGASELVIRVADTGSGIDPALLPHVFERYYRGEEARTRRHSGSGLGLAIAQAIARAHGGTLSVESAPGEGSTFTLRLPRRDPSPAE